MTVGINFYYTQKTLKIIFPALVWQFFCCDFCLLDPIRILHVDPGQRCLQQCVSVRFQPHITDLNADPDSHNEMLYIYIFYIFTFDLKARSSLRYWL